MSLREWLYKIGGSPSSSLLFWTGAFVAGIAAATGFFPNAYLPSLRLIGISSFIAAIIGGFAIKEKEIRLFAVAGFLFFFGAIHCASSSETQIDLLKLFPFLSGTKTWLLGAVSHMLPEPQAGFLNGLLVGGGIRSSELKAAFVATGTAHVMALSGWNVNIISRWLDNLLVFCRLPKRARWALIAAALIAFVVMTGAAASLVRAAAMSLITTMALSSGRKAAPTRALAFAASAMLLASPRLLYADLGFSLSVAATAGIIFLAPIFLPLARRLPDLLGLPATAAETLGATVATLPITLCAFGQFSFVSFPANLLLLPAIPATIAVGFSASMIAGTVPSFAAPCRWAADAFIAYDLSLVKLLSRAPGSIVSGAYAPWFLSAAMAVSVICILTYARHHPFKKENRR